MSKLTDTQKANIVKTYVREAVESKADYASRSAVVKALADELNVSEPVVRGVLVSENVYLSKEVTKTKGETKAKAKKVDFIKAFEASFGMSIPSMEKMTLKDLEAFWNRFVELSDTRDVA